MLLVLKVYIYILYILQILEKNQNINSPDAVTV